MSPSRLALGIDFGTSNSALAVAAPGQAARPVALEGTATAMPTALFFDFEERSTHFGRDAMARYLSGAEGRLMRSLKSLLGSSLLLEKTAVHGQLVSFQDIIGFFLRELAARASAAFDGAVPAQVVVGRPVHFVDDDPVKDREAEDALRAAAKGAGLGEVLFQPEPIAAALDYESRLDREQLVLVADIGGGTSDFTVVRLGPGRAGRLDRSADLLATTGVHIGGTDFDQRLNLALAMPLLGLGHTGPHGREVPSRVFHDLATWHLIHWQYTAQALRAAQALRSDYRDPALHRRLLTVLDHQYGHRIAAEVERTKIAASSADAEAWLDLDFIESTLGAPLPPGPLGDHLAAPLARVAACAQDCVQRAGVKADALDAIYLTGGSSALRPFQAALRAAFPGVPLVEGDLFGGVAAGLAVTAALV